MIQQAHQANGELTISRQEGGVGRRFCISYTDEASRARVEIYLTPEQFGEAVTGLGQVGIPAEWRVQRLGPRREHKLVEVPWSGVGNKQLALAPFEAEGWQGRVGDLDNHHNQVRGKEQQRKGGTVTFWKVVFERWV